MIHAENPPPTRPPFIKISQGFVKAYPIHATRGKSSSRCRGRARGVGGRRRGSDGCCFCGCDNDGDKAHHITVRLPVTRQEVCGLFFPCRAHVLSSIALDIFCRGRVSPGVFGYSPGSSLAEEPPVLETSLIFAFPHRVEREMHLGLELPCAKNTSEHRPFSIVWHPLSENFRSANLVCSVSFERVTPTTVGVCGKPFCAGVVRFVAWCAFGGTDKCAYVRNGIHFSGVRVTGNTTNGSLLIERAAL